DHPLRAAGRVGRGDRSARRQAPVARPGAVLPARRPEARRDAPEAGRRAPDRPAAPRAGPRDRPAARRDRPPALRARPPGIDPDERSAARTAGSAPGPARRAPEAGRRVGASPGPAGARSHPSATARGFGAPPQRADAGLPRLSPAGSLRPVRPPGGSGAAAGRGALSPICGAHGALELRRHRSRREGARAVRGRRAGVRPARRSRTARHDPVPQEDVARRGRPPPRPGPVQDQDRSARHRIAVQEGAGSPRGRALPGCDPAARVRLRLRSRQRPVSRRARPRPLPPLALDRRLEGHARPARDPADRPPLRSRRALSRRDRGAARQPGRGGGGAAPGDPPDGARPPADRGAQGPPEPPEALSSLILGRQQTFTSGGPAMRRRARRILVAAALPLALLAAVAASGARTQKPPLHAAHWLAITGKPLAATAGSMMFEKGGNAVDAAAAMLAATCTMWDTLAWGGETQALIYNPKTGKVI